MVSWDNRKIAFTNGRRNELWVRELAGRNERRVLSAPAGSTIPALAWSSDNRHVAFLERHEGGRFVNIRIVDTVSEVTRVVTSQPRVTTFCWAPDGRLTYNVGEPPPNENSENLWELTVTPSGEITAPPRRLTDLFGFQFAMLRSSADGNLVSYIRWRQQSDVLTARILGPGRIGMPQRLTQDERIDWPSAWRDDRTILFFSDRAGSFDLYEQQTGTAAPTALLTDRTEKRYPQLDADRKWLLYLAWPLTPIDRPPTKGWLMRLPTQGGTPLQVSSVSGYPGSARVVLDGYVGLTTRGHPRFRCPAKGSAPCVLSEIVDRQLVLTAVDPLRGRLGIIARFSYDPAEVSFWDLSPDGTRLVVGTPSETGAPLEILDLNGWKVTRRMHVAIGDWNLLQDVAWSPDQQSIYLVAFRSNGDPLLYATLDGHATVLHRGFTLSHPTVSPDGMWMAFGEVTAESNAWVLDRGKRPRLSR